jgi:hypothetical protein
VVDDSAPSTGPNLEPEGAGLRQTAQNDATAARVCHPGDEFDEEVEAGGLEGRTPCFGGEVTTTGAFGDVIDEPVELGVQRGCIG